MKAFVSYSHQDAAHLTALREHLATLKRLKLLETWTDREIDAGGVLDDEISQAMDEAGIFLLLISPSFLHSDYCFEKEFQRALTRHEAGQVRIVPIIVRPCDWHIPPLKKFKALPEDGKPVVSQHWHSPDEAFADVARKLRIMLEKPNPAPKFVPDERHVTKEQRDDLNRIHHEVVERLTARKNTQPDAVVQKEIGKWSGIVWSQLFEKFGIQENKLLSLRRDQYEEAKQWLLEYRASNDSKLARTNPQKLRNTYTRTIYTIARALGWSKDEVYAFAREKLESSIPVSSLDELGNQQVKTLRDRIRYEQTKRTAKTSQTKATKSRALKQPTNQAAREILEMILAHPVLDERGLTEITRESPTGPLDMCIIPNNTASGSASCVRKSILRPAIAELVQLGWLLPPEAGAGVRIYELNPQAAQS